MATMIDTDRVADLAEAGAVLLEVLPAADYRREHLPGAVNIPLPELTREAAEGLGRDRPIVVYCYDLQCDLSSRGAALLEAYGHPEVYDYAASKVAWFAMDRGAEGTVPDPERAGVIARPAATCGPDAALGDLPEAGPGGVVLVVDHRRVVLGALWPDLVARAGADLTALDVAHPAPTSVRPSITASELARSMDRSGERYVVVSTLDGVLVGIVEREDLDRSVDR
jgi:rhodanese-related sulfurtransferase